DSSATIAITTAAKTSDLTPVITGTSDFGSNQLVTVTISGATYTNLTGAGGNWSIDIGTATPFSGTLTPLTNGGVYTIGASGTDVAGNFATNSKSLTVDTAAPGILITTPVGDTITVDGKVDATEDNAVTISGTTTNIPNGSTIIVYITDGTTTLLVTTNIVTTNTWTIGANNLSALLNGTITITASYTDDGGTTYTDTATFNHDKSGALTIDAIAVDTGSSSTDFITMSNRLVFSGSTTVPGGTVGLTLTNAVAGTNVITTSVVADSTGAWIFNYTNVALASNATYVLIATNSGATNTQTIVIDNTPPAGPVTVTAPGTTSDTTPTITGTVTLSPGETFTVTIDGVTYTVGDGNLSTNGGGGWSLTIPPSDALTPATSGGGGFNGVYVITATITDVAGNSLSSTGSITISDTTAPIVDLDTGSGGLNYSVSGVTNQLVSLDNDATPASLTEATDLVPLVKIGVSGLHNDALEKLVFGSTVMAASGDDGSQNDILVGGVRINVTWATNTFAIQKYDYTELTAAEAQAIIQNIAYSNSAPIISSGTRTFTFIAVDAAGNESSPAVASVNVVGVGDAELTAATGGEAISADTFATGAYTLLTGPFLDEKATGNISTGTIVLTLPSGFEYDTGSAVSVNIVNSSGTGTLLTLSSGSVTPTLSTITINITSASSSGAIGQLTWSGIRVRPTAGTPLASGIITNAGTAVITGVPDYTNWATLGEVHGVVSAYRITAASSSVTAGTSDQLTVRQVDQFGNTVTTFTGDLPLTFSGLGGLPSYSPTVTDTNPAPVALTNVTYISFTNGVSSVGGLLVPYMVETATVNVYDGTRSSTNTGGSGAPVTVIGATATQMYFSTQPDKAQVSTNFFQQPVVKSADQFGNYSSNGLPSSLIVSLTHTSGAGVLSGTTNLDIGTGSGNGTVTYTNLVIDTAGKTNQLTATVTSFLTTPTVVSSYFDVWSVYMAPNDHIIADRGEYAANGRVMIFRNMDTNQIVLVTSIKDPYEIDLDANGDIITINSTSYAYGSLFKIDKLTLEVTALSVSNYFRTPGLVKVESKAPNAGKILVGDLAAFNHVGGIIRVDPTTGGQTPLTIGTNILNITGLSVAPAAAPNYGDIFVSSVGDGGSVSSKLIRVNPINGVQSIVTAGTNFVYPVGSVVETNGNIVVVDALAKKLIRVDPSTGAQTVLSDAAVTSYVGEPVFIQPTHIAMDSNGDFFVTDAKANQLANGRTLIKVNKTTGSRTLITYGGFFEQPRGVILSR
ncbi:MAG TPA: hypothetical protein VK968_03505, partial [Roseimicrobium sp.]|nr:hypothetical protein [Roseimicrobium sp.]